MPPPQCPDCGRFLSHDFVEGLAASSASCPRCGTVLHAEQFEPTDRSTESPVEASQAHRPEADTVRATGRGSVRPPDLDPASLREEARDNGRGSGGRDVLEGWDLPGVAAPVVEDANSEELVVAAGTILVAGVAGGLVGAFVSGRHRTIGAVIGTLAGATVAAAGSRIFTPSRPAP